MKKTLWKLSIFVCLIITVFAFAFAINGNPKAAFADVSSEIYKVTCGANTLYVNTVSGDDSAAGTEAAPFKTLGKAKRTAATENADGTPLTVQKFEEGEWTTTETGIVVKSLTTLQALGENGGKAYIGGTFDINPRVKVEAETTLTVDFCGFTLTSSLPKANTSIVFVVHGELLIDDSTAYFTDEELVGVNKYEVNDEKGKYYVSGGVVSTTASNGVYGEGGKVNINNGVIKVASKPLWLTKTTDDKYSSIDYINYAYLKGTSYAIHLQNYTSVGIINGGYFDGTHALYVSNSTVNEINGGTFIGSTHALYVSNSTVNEISGGTFIGGSAASNYAINMASGAKIGTINGGTFISTTSYCLYLDSATINEINDGVFTSGNNCIYLLSGGKIGTINGGTFTASGVGKYAISLTNASIDEINGGKFVSEKSYAVYLNHASGSIKIFNGEFEGKGAGVVVTGANGGSVTISGGKFTNKNNESVVGQGFSLYRTNVNGIFTLSGGQFKPFGEEVSNIEIPASFIADGYGISDSVDADGFYYCDLLENLGAPSELPIINILIDGVDKGAITSNSEFVVQYKKQDGYYIVTLTNVTNTVKLYDNGIEILNPTIVGATYTYHVEHTWESGHELLLTAYNEEGGYRITRLTIFLSLTGVDIMQDLVTATAPVVIVNDSVYPWVFDSKNTDGVVFKSGNYNVPNSQSVLTLYVFGSGTLSFDRACETQASSDIFELYIDGVRKFFIKTPMDWENYTVDISSDTLHKIEFRYAKLEGAGTEYSGDCAWISNINWELTSQFDSLVMTLDNSYPIGGQLNSRNVKIQTLFENEAIIDVTSFCQFDYDFSSLGTKTITAHLGKFSVSEEAIVLERAILPEEIYLNLNGVMHDVKADESFLIELDTPFAFTLTLTNPQGELSVFLNGQPLILTDLGEGVHVCSFESDYSRLYEISIISEQVNSHPTQRLIEISPPRDVVFIGDVGYGTLEDALDAAVSGDIIILKKNYTLRQNIIIPAGVEVVIPFNAAGQYYALGTATTAQGRVSWGTAALINTYRYITLTINSDVIIMVEGKLYVGAVMHYPDQSAQGHTSGAYSEIVNNGSIVVNNGGLFDVYGRVWGSGTVTVNSGGTLYQPFMICDYAGGTNTEGLFDLDQAPFNRYAMVNIECEITLYYGANLCGHASLFFYSSVTTHDASFITYESSDLTGLIVLTEPTSYVVIKYDNSHVRPSSIGVENAEDVGKTKIDIYGGAYAGYMQFPMGIDTSEVYFSVPYNLEIVLHNGEYEFKYAYKFMPGSILKVEEGATLIVSKGLYIYDGLTSSDMSGKAYPSASALTAAGYFPNATFILNGTLIIEEGGIFGGVVQTGRAGAKIITEIGAILENEVTDGGTTIYDCNIAKFDLNARAVVGNRLVDLQTGKTYVSNSGTNIFLIGEFVVDYAVNCAADDPAYAPELYSSSYKNSHKWANTIMNITTEMRGAFVEELGVGSYGAKYEIYIGSAVSGVKVTIDGVQYTTDANGKFKVYLTFTDPANIKVLYKTTFDSDYVSEEFVAGQDIVLTKVVKSVEYSTGNIYQRIYNTTNGSINSDFSLFAVVSYYGDSVDKSVQLTFIEQPSTWKYVNENITLKNADYTKTFKPTLYCVLAQLTEYIEDYTLLGTQETDALRLSYAKALNEAYSAILGGYLTESAEYIFITDYLESIEISSEYRSEIALSFVLVGGQAYGQTAYSATATMLDDSTRTVVVDAISFEFDGNLIAHCEFDNIYDENSYKINFDGTVTKRTVTLTISGDRTVTYDGNFHTLYATINNSVSGDDLNVAVNGSYKTVGTHAVEFSLSGDEVIYYVLDKTYSESITITKATPTITTNPLASGIFVGQTLSSSTLSNGAASVEGTFSWTTPTTVVTAEAESYSVTFVPTDTTNYNVVTFNVYVTTTQLTVTFKDNGEEDRVVNVNYGGTVDKSIYTPTIRTGYSAVWSDTDTANITSNVAVTAIYTPNTYNISVTFNGGTANVPEIHTYDSATVIPNAQKTGYTFLGYKVNGGGAVKDLTLGATDYTGDITLEAVFTINSYTVTVTATKGSVTITADDAVISSGDEVNYLTQLEFIVTAEEGYEFVGWYVGGIQVSVSATYQRTMPSENYTIEARFKASTDTSYTVEHYFESIDDDDYTMQPVETLYGVTGALATATPRTVAGLTFDVNISGTISSAIINGDGSTVLKLYYTRAKYTVTFDHDGENIIVTVKHGATLDKANYDPTERTGYTVAWDNTVTTNITSSLIVKAEYTLNNPTVELSSSLIPEKYDGSTITLTAAPSHGAKGITYTYVWYKNNVDLKLPENTDSLSLSNVLDSGTYKVKVTATVGDDSNFAEATITVVINPATMTVTSEGYNSQYDGGWHGITVTVTAPLGATVEYSLNGTSGWSTTLPTLINVTIQAVPVYYRVTMTNYNTVTGSNTVTITPREVTLSITGAGTFVYDGQSHALSATIIDALEEDITKGYLIVIGGGSITNVDTLNATFTLDGIKVNNYKLVGEDSAMLTVTPLKLEITIDNRTSIYGEGLDTPIAKRAQGTAVPLDAFSNIFKLETGDWREAGEYDITINCFNENYTVECDDIVYTITKRAITVAVQNQSSVYGDSLNNVVFALSSGSAKLVFEDKISDIVRFVITKDDLPVDTSGNLSAGVYKIVGLDYDIEGKVLNGNYTVTFTGDRVYTITRREIKFNICDAQSIYGEDFVTPSVTIENGYSLAFNDCISDIMNLIYNPLAKTGSYNITAETKGIGNTDYSVEFIYTKGSYSVYTVNKRPITIVIENAEAENNADWAGVISKLSSKVSSDSPYSLVSGDDLSHLSIQLRIVISDGLHLTQANFETYYAGGIYEIIGVYSHSDYEVTFVKGEFKVTKKLIEITNITNTFVFTGSAISAFDWANNISGYLPSASENSFKAEYFKDGVKTDPIDAGEYTMKITIIHTNAYEFVGDEYEAEITITVTKKDISDEITPVGLEDGGTVPYIAGMEVGAQSGDYDVLLTIALYKENIAVERIDGQGEYALTVTVSDGENNYFGSKTFTFTVVKNVRGDMTTLDSYLAQYADKETSAEKLAILLQMKELLVGFTEDDWEQIESSEDYQSLIEESRAKYALYVAAIEADAQVAYRVGDKLIPNFIRILFSVLALAGCIIFKKRGF